MYFLYSAFTVLMLPLAVVRLFIKSRKQPVYRKRILERFAWNSPRPPQVDIWIHAVSLGEVTAVTPFIKVLLSMGQRVMVTTTTATGSARLREAFGDAVAHQYLPYDVFYFQRRFLRAIQPKKVIIVETELWPNLVRAVHEAGIPLYLMNARLSARSLVGYHKIQWFIAPVLQQFTKILAQSPEDAERFQSLGASSAQVKATGNIKFDCALPAEGQLAIAKAMEAHCTRGRFVVIAASTHANEEEQILGIYRQLKQHIPSLLLMMAPRHPDRFKEVERLIAQQELSFAKRSDRASWSSACDTLLIDSIGELSAFYTLSHIAFVGGSLVPIGGHNMLEPIIAHIPVICGPHLDNFKSIAAGLLSAKAMLRINDPTELATEIQRLHGSEEARNSLIKNASIVLKRNQGAMQRYIAEIF